MPHEGIQALALCRLSAKGAAQLWNGYSWLSKNISMHMPAITHSRSTCMHKARVRITSCLTV